MGVEITYKRIKCRHCDQFLYLKQATDGTWIVTMQIETDKSKIVKEKR
jgi:hypothetical protein